MSEEFIGRDISYAVAMETIRGTAEATADKTVRKVECNILPKTESVIDDSVSNGLEDSENTRVVRRWSEGDVSGVVHADTIGYDLANLYGSVTSIFNGSAYDHTYELEQSIAHPTFTSFVKDGGVRQVKIAGCVVSTLEITASTDDLVRYSKTIIGKEGVDDTSTIPAIGTDYDFVSRDIAVKIASTEAGLAGTTTFKLKSLTINWNSNAEADWVFGSYSPDNIYNKQFAIEGSFERNYTDQTFEDLYNSKGFVYVNFNIKGEAVLSTGVNPEFDMIGYKLQVTDWNRTSAGDALVTETVSFKLFKNVTDGAQSTVNLTNLTPTYVIGS